MSDLQKAWAKAKLSALEPFDEGAERRELEEAADSLGELPEPMDDDSSSASSASSTGPVIPSPSQRLFARPQAYVVPLYPFFFFYLGGGRTIAAY